MYLLFLKNLPEYSRSRYDFTSMEDVKKCLSIIPEKYIEELRERKNGSSKPKKLPAVEGRPNSATAYVVDHISPNGFWRERSVHIVGDGINVDEALNFLVYEGGTWHGEAKILSYRPMQDGEEVEPISYFRNKRTGEYGPKMYPYDRKTVEIKHGLFKKEAHVRLKELRDKEGAVLFEYKSWGSCYSKNIGKGRFELVFDSSGTYGKEAEFRKEIGSFEDAVRHVCKEDFLDLLDLDGDAEQYIPLKPSLGWDHHQDYDSSEEYDEEEIVEIGSYFHSEDCGSHMKNGVRVHLTPFGSFFGGLPGAKKKTSAFFDPAVGKITDEFYGNCTDFNEWLVGKIAKNEKFFILGFDEEGTPFQVHQANGMIGEVTAKFRCNKLGQWRAVIA